MEERSFQLNDRVVVEDERGQIGSGVIIGRTYADPMRYDVLIEQTVYASMPHGTIRHVQ